MTTKNTKSKKAAAKKTPAKAAKKPTRKKAAKPSKDEAEAKVLGKIHHDDDGYPSLTERQLLLFISKNAQAELSKAHLDSVRKDIKLLLQEIPQYKQLKQNEQAAKHDFEKKSRDYMGTLESLSAELGIDMTRCIINDHTGRLTFVDETGKPCPEIPIYDPKKK